MCKISSPPFPLFSLLIATDASPKGDSIGQHFARHGCKVRYALPNEVLAGVQQHRPDCLLISAKFGDALSGISLCRQVRALIHSSTKCLLLLPTDFNDFLMAFYADASGYLRQGAPIEEIEIALTRLAAGERYVHPAMFREFLQDARMPAYLDYVKPLSKREQEIFRYAGYGYKTSEIAKHLFISDKTVETHKMHIMQKLDLGSAHQLRETAMFQVQALPPLHH